MRSLRTHQRGQTMVLFALSMLLLVFMVMTTIALGTRVKERIELQTVADASAYSSAVTTARTYNTISILNRVNIAHMVAAAGTQALQSWTSLYISGAGELYRMLDRPPLRPVNTGVRRNNYCNLVWNYWIMAQFGNPLDRVTPVTKFATHIGLRGPDYVAMDIGFEAVIQQRFMAGMAIFGIQMGEAFGILRGTLNDQDIAQEIARNSANGSRYSSELSAPATADAVSMDEAGVDIAAGCQGAVCYPPAYVPDHLALAAMGSRGYNFVTGRDDGDVLAQRLKNLIKRDGRAIPGSQPRLGMDTGGYMITINAPPVMVAVVPLMPFLEFGLMEADMDVRVTDVRGSTYWSNLPWVTHSSPTLLGAMGTFMWSDDHGRISVRKNSIMNLSTHPPIPLGVGYSNGFPIPIGPWPNRGWIPRNCGGAATPTNDIGASVATTGLPLGSLHTADPPPTSFNMWVLAGPVWFLPDVGDRGEGSRLEVMSPVMHAVGLWGAPWIYAIPPLLDFNWTQLNEIDNNQGQPKLYSLVERNYAVRAGSANKDPWDQLDFTASWGGGAGERFALTATEGSKVGAAFASGVAYYHRGSTPLFGDHWEEPPNFLNPRWRATLAAPDIEALERQRLMGAGRSDIRRTLATSSNPDAVRVFDMMNAMSPNSGGERYLLGAQ